MSFKPILKFGTKRLLASIGILLGVSLLTFFIAEAISVDTRIRLRFGLFIGLFDGYYDDYDFIELYNRYGFEMGLLEEDGTPIPALKRYLQWLGLMRDNKGTYNGMFQGKFGLSWTNYETLIENVIMPNIWFTILLSTINFTILTFTALIVGTIFFSKRNLNSSEHSQKDISKRIIILPVLLLSVFFIAIFSQVLGLERVNYDDTIIEPFILSEEFYMYLILPLLILIIWSVAFALRITANNAEEILSKKYQTYMNYSGYTQRQKIRIIMKNQSSFLLLYFRNNLSMIYSVLAIIEIIFKLPGLGTLIKIYSRNRDLPGLLACMVLFSLIIVVHKFLLEMILVCLDPRILSGEIKFNFATINNREIHQS
ncbi:MAG: ABC transporter permease subunit [Candidatus Heimdallarchaeota archaeon]|nr:ABC transporter permease subunit [Candidatus Heimdallarchaeota archaeon]